MADHGEIRKDPVFTRVAKLLGARTRGEEDNERAEMSPEDVARWHGARTLADLGELTAR